MRAKGTMEESMDLLITVLGNALVQGKFRERLLSGEDPVREAETWGFRLTKGEGEMLRAMFTGSDEYIEDLRTKFDALEDQVYINMTCDKPCKMTVGPPLCPPPLPKAA